MLTSDHAATKAPPLSQRGATLLLFMLGLFAAVATYFAIKLLEPASRVSKQVERTVGSLGTIEQALAAFVAINGRLPCPANGALETGIADPDGAASNCNSAEGTVPWATLGLPEATVLDGWNRKISYRVFNGVGGLTQADGASMVQCDTKMPYGAEPLKLPEKLCKTPPPNSRNLDTQFLVGKGFSVSNLGATENGVAYVLLSHGESGVGAWPQGGALRTLPPPGNELSNTTAAGPFVKATHSDQGVDPMSAAHFDDVIAWATITDIVKRAGRQARDWPDPAPPPEITPSTTSNMNVAGTGHFNATTAAGGQTFTATDGGNTLDFGGGGGFYANCAWWPSSFRLYNGADRFALRSYVEFATSSELTAFGGFTVGFLSKSETDSFSSSSSIPFTGLCGNTLFSRELGWGNWITGNLPPPRFAVEFDAFQHGAVSDPGPNHLAVDFNDVRHTGGTSASVCSAVPNTYHSNGTQNDCYTAPDNSWLRSGLTEFHRMRIEITPYDTACSSGAAPKVTVWVAPRSLCPDVNPDAVCNTMKNLAIGFVPPAPLPTGMVTIESCIPAPSPTAAFDQLYFGFTAARRNDGATSSVLYLRNLNAGVYFIP